MTTAQRYRGLRNRFNRRAARLASLGFRYERLEGYPIAAFVRRDAINRPSIILVSTIHHASNECFVDELRSRLRSR